MSNSEPDLLLRAPLVQLAPDRCVEDGAVLLRGGRVLEAGDWGRVAAVAGAGVRRVEVEGGLLGAGLVNAHAHLELGGLAGLLERGTGSFGGWIRSLMRTRAELGEAALERGLNAGLRRAQLTGTTRIADIDSLGLGATDERGGRQRFVELLDAGDAQRAGLEGERARELAGSDSELGFSPHAPYTVSTGLMKRLARVAQGHPGVRLAVHWSETQDELSWWETGRGGLAELLGRGPDPGQRSHPGSLDWMVACGLPLRRTALIHGNWPAPGEPERLARSGATLVHCPGCHAWFGREPFPLRRYLDAGVPVALGTDSLASNEDLDLLREADLLRRGAPDASPAEVWAMLTTTGARWLGLAGGGVLEPGARADLTALRVGTGDPAAALDQVTSGAAEVAGVWLEGEPVAIT